MSLKAIVRCRWAAPFAEHLTRGKEYGVFDGDAERLMLQVMDDSSEKRWYPAECFAGDRVGDIVMEIHFTPPDKDAEDPHHAPVVIERLDGTRWHGLCVTFDVIEQLSKKTRKARERDKAVFYWQPGLILVRELTRECVEFAIDRLSDLQMFEAAFIPHRAPSAMRDPRAADDDGAPDGCADMR